MLDLFTTIFLNIYTVLIISFIRGTYIIFRLKENRPFQFARNLILLSNINIPDFIIWVREAEKKSSINEQTFKALNPPPAPRA